MKDEIRLIILIVAALLMGFGGGIMLFTIPGAALIIFGITIIFFAYGIIEILL